jgi:hypothetical protein
MSSSCLVDWCGHDAARYAVEHWHYSCRLPGGKRAALGVWEEGRFVGAVVFGSGATPMSHRPFGVAPEEVCELVRVALDARCTPVSRVLRIACTMLLREMPGLRVVVSFADTARGHHGGIYQAAGWTYLGTTAQRYYLVSGHVVHPRTLHSRYGYGGQSITWLREHVDPYAVEVPVPVKHKYAKPLDAAMRAQLASLARPYPRPAGVGSSTDGDQPSGAGATPSAGLNASDQ